MIKVAFYQWGKAALFSEWWDKDLNLENQTDK